MSGTIEVPQATSVFRLPLVKRKNRTSKGMQAVKNLEPSHVMLCERGAQICKSKGIRSVHLKRSSNAIYVAATMKNPHTGRRRSVALWKVVCLRWEDGWSVRYVNRSIFDLRLENLQSQEPKPQEPEAEEPEAEEPEDETQDAAKVVDPAIIEVQIGLVAERAQEFQTYLRKTAYNVLRKGGIYRNLFELSEDLVSDMMPDLWKQILKGNVKHVSYTGVRGWGAKCIQKQAQKLARLGRGGHWGHSIPEKPHRAAKYEIKLLEYNTAFSDAAKAEADGQLKARPTSAATDADSQWSHTFGRHVQRTVSAEQKRLGITLDDKPVEPALPRKKTVTKKRKKRTD